VRSSDGMLMTVTVDGEFTTELGPTVDLGGPLPLRAGPWAPAAAASGPSGSTP
jgi:hypothetical protein